MSSTPQLSYKKPSLNSPKVQSTSSFTQEANDSSPSATPVAATRKVSRRKALQDFYKMEDAKKGEPKAIDSDSKVPTSEADLQEFLQTSSMEEILKLRNDVSGRQSSQDLEKKEIIYDNYYELIKLSETLNNLSKPSLKKSAGLQIIQQDTISDTYVDETLQELSNFISNDATKFSDDFRNVLKNLNQNEADDSASVTAIVDSKEPIPENIDRAKLIQEINSLLSAGKHDSDLKQKMELEIHLILEKLDYKLEELLILQLNDIKNKLI